MLEDSVCDPSDLLTLVYAKYVHGANFVNWPSVDARPRGLCPVLNYNDSVNQESLWLTIKKYGIPKKIVKIVKTFYKDFQWAVERQGEICKWLKLKVVSNRDATF